MEFPFTHRFAPPHRKKAALPILIKQLTASYLKSVTFLKTSQLQYHCSEILSILELTDLQWSYTQKKIANIDSCCFTKLHRFLVFHAACFANPIIQALFCTDRGCQCFTLLAIQYWIFGGKIRNWKQYKNIAEVVKSQEFFDV